MAQEQVGVTIKTSVVGQQEVDKLTASILQVGKAGENSAKQTAAAFRMLPAQFNDIAVSLAGGQNPFLVLLQQGSQITESFGGVRGAFAAISSVLTPFRVAMIGTAGAVALAAKAFYDGHTEAREFGRAIALTGNAAGTTFDGYRRLAADIAASTALTIGDTKQIVQALVAAGTIGPTAIEPVAKAIALVQEISGKTADEVMKDFASMSRGVADWAQANARQYGYLTIEQYKYIRQLEAQGKYEEAAAYNARLLTEALEKRKPELGAIETLYVKIKEAASSAWDAMMGIGRPQSNTEQLRGLEQRLQFLQKEANLEAARNSPSRAARNAVAEIQKQIAALKEKIVAEEEAAKAEGAARQKNAKEIEEYDRMQAARRELAVQLSKSYADRAIQQIEAEREALRVSLEKREITDQEYAQRFFQLKAKEIAARKTLQVELQKIEESRDVKDAPDAKQRANRVAEYQAEIDKLTRQVDLEYRRSQNDVALIDRRKALELATYNDQLQKTNDLLQLEAQRVTMTEFAYKQMVDAKNFEYEVRQKTRNMTAEEAEQYRQLAKAQFEARQSIEFDNYNRSRMPLTGAQEAVKKYNDEVSNSAKLTEQAFTRAFKATEDALVEFAMTGKLNFEQLANSIIRDLIRISIQQSIMKPLTDFLGSSGGSGILSTLAGVFTGKPVTQANGGVWMDGVQKFASGGVVTKPTLFPMANGAGLMGEAGPEAILPLRRNAAGQLGVMADGSKTSVVINNFSTERAEAKETVDSRGQRRIEVTIGELVAGEVRRAGSAANAAIRDTFGARPALVGR